MERNITAINFLDMFCSSGLAILVPLLLLARGVEVSEIGLILSALPLVFLFARMLFAALGDQVGFKPFFIIDWLAQLSAVAIYLLAASPLGFLFGKIAEGIRASAFWAVARTAIFHYAKGKESEEAVRLSVIRTAGSATGTAAAGMIAAFFSLHHAFLLLFAAALLQGIPSLMLRPGLKGRFGVRKTVYLLSPFGKGKRFWLASLALGLYALAVYPVFTLVAPIVMKRDLGMGYDSIGYIIAAYYLLNTLGTYLAMGLSSSRLSMLQTLVFGTGALAIACTGSSLLFGPFLLLIALGDGLSLLFFEAVIAHTTKGKPTVSTDIGFLHVPFRLAEFVSVICAGFAFQYLSYHVVFLVSALAFAAYSLLAWRLLAKTSDKT